MATVTSVTVVLVSVQDLAKDLGSRAGLMAAVGGAGARMVQLRGGDSPDSALQAQLRQVDLDWSHLLEDVPSVQTAVQEVRLRPLPGVGEGGNAAV